MAVVVVALARLTAPNCPLAITAMSFGVLVFTGEIVGNLQVVQPRYVIAPALPLYTAIVAMLRPRGVVTAVNVRVLNNRSESSPWTAAVAAATHTCMKPGMGEHVYRHARRQLSIPCSRV